MAKYNYTITIDECATSLEGIARVFFDFVGCATPLNDSFLGKTPLAFLDTEKLNSDKTRGVIRALDKYALDPEKLRTHREIRKKFKTEEQLSEFATYLQELASAEELHSPTIRTDEQVLFGYTTASGKAGVQISKKGECGGYELKGHIHLDGTPDIVAKQLTDAGIDVWIEVNDISIDLNKLASHLRKREMTVCVSARKRIG